MVGRTSCVWFAGRSICPASWETSQFVACRTPKGFRKNAAVVEVAKRECRTEGRATMMTMLGVESEKRKPV